MIGPLRGIIGAVLLLCAVRLFGGDQPELRAPWAGAAVITQGNRSTCSHNEGVFRTCIDHSTAWENTWALDIVKLTNGAPTTFDVLAPADGVIGNFIDDPLKRTGGRQLWLNVTGPTGKAFQIVFMHLSEIKQAYKVVGAKVQRGDVIAVSGNTTSATKKPGIHLHMHIFSGPPATRPDASPSPDSHTQPIEALRLIAAGETTARVYESKRGGMLDDPLKMSLNDDSVAQKTFTSDNVPSAPRPVTAELLKNGSFQTITAPTNVAADGSWIRTMYSGSTFNTLTGGGTWGNNGSSAYAYLGVYDNATQVIDSAAFLVPSTATAADLRFWVSIVTKEGTTTTAYDRLTFSLVDASTGATLTTPGYMSNLSATDAPTAYVSRQWAVSITPIRGRMVRLRMTASCDSSLPTTWRVDDVSLSTR